MNSQQTIYSVKYLGIVDGSMAILSRKMALQSLGPLPKLPYVLPKNRNRTKTLDKPKLINQPVLSKPFTERRKQQEINTEQEIQKLQKRSQGRPYSQGNQFQVIPQNRVSVNQKSYQIAIDKPNTTNGTRQRVNFSPYNSLNRQTIAFDENFTSSQKKENELGKISISDNGIGTAEQKNVSDFSTDLKNKFKTESETRQVLMDVAVSVKSSQHLVTPFKQIEQGEIFNQKVTGYPDPKQYDQFFINKYSLPKGLIAVRHAEKEQKNQTGLYDLKQPQQRCGLSGWKLTRRGPQIPQPQVTTQKIRRRQDKSRSDGNPLSALEKLAQYQLQHGEHDQTNLNLMPFSQQEQAIRIPS